MLRTSIILFFIAVIGLPRSAAQELNLNVSINTPALKLADPKVFQTLEQSIKEFMNQTIWTDDDFLQEERIEGSLQINIVDDLSTNTFVADFYLSTSRPIYSSNYYSQLLNHVDKDITFSYQEFGPIYNNRTSFSDNLSAILTYYAYVILGFDYDSFSLFGGDPYFQIAKDIVSSVPPSVSSTDRSWLAIGSSRNRYWLVENVLNPRVRPFRQAFYDYHRKSLDKMYNDPDRSRAILMSALKSVNDVHQEFQNSMIVKMFSDSKRQEILDIFISAGRGEKQRVYEIMTQLDPAQSSEFSALRK